MRIGHVGPMGDKHVVLASTNDLLFEGARGVSFPAGHGTEPFLVMLCGCRQLFHPFPLNKPWTRITRLRGRRVIPLSAARRDLDTSGGGLSLGWRVEDTLRGLIPFGSRKTSDLFALFRPGFFKK